MPLFAGDEEFPVVKAGDCQFTQDPEAYLKKMDRVRQDVFQRASKLSRNAALGEEPRLVNASDLPRRNFIDDEIFGRLAAQSIGAAPLSTDEEFIRRVMLDLTGRIPTPAQFREFVGSTDQNKRAALIDKLLYSPEFTTKWAMWLGDLLGNRDTTSTVANQPTIDGRNAFYDWISKAIATDKPLTAVATEVIVGSVPGAVPRTAADVAADEAVNHTHKYGASNYALLATTAMGPVQDTYDTMLSKTASQFLGISHYDCLLCHNGRGHLDSLSLWAKNTSRMEAQQMASFFSRMRWTRLPLNNNTASAEYLAYTPEIKAIVNGYKVYDATTGQYDLNTTAGNRPNRQPLGAAPNLVRNLTPEYRATGVTPKDGNWRAAYAENLIKDPMFARNFANRIWKAVFNLGLVEPVDQLDPARLDPSNPPPSPWTLQATHPELLEKLAAELAARNFSLREFLRLLVESTSYQLSSRYDGEWKLDYVSLFARHYPRRLDAEEIHDAVIVATGVKATYNFTGRFPAEPTTWAMQFPDPTEPRGAIVNGASVNWLNSFLRGNRDTQPRSQAGSILQELNLMNDGFVVNRTRVSGTTPSPILIEIAKLGSTAAVVDELFLTYLGRMPTASERAAAAGHFASLGTTAAAKNTAVEDLAWALVNKTDFLFSY